MKNSIDTNNPFILVVVCAWWSKRLRSARSFFSNTAFDHMTELINDKKWDSPQNSCLLLAYTSSSTPVWVFRRKPGNLHRPNGQSLSATIACMCAHRSSLYACIPVADSSHRKQTEKTDNRGKAKNDEVVREASVVTLPGLNSFFSFFALLITRLDHKLHHHCSSNITRHSHPRTQCSWTPTSSRIPFNTSSTSSRRWWTVYMPSAFPLSPTAYWPN